MVNHNSSSSPLLRFSDCETPFTADSTQGDGLRCGYLVPLYPGQAAAKSCSQQARYVLDIPSIRSFLTDHRREKPKDKYSIYAVLQTISTLRLV